MHDTHRSTLVLGGDDSASLKTVTPVKAGVSKFKSLTPVPEKAQVVSGDSAGFVIDHQEEIRKEFKAHFERARSQHQEMMFHQVKAVAKASREL
jgi:uncharacterized cupredoxin-like copper-binding protein